MPLQDPKHPANVQVIYARIYGALVIAILISTFMYGVSLVSLSLLCRIAAVMSEHTVTPVDRSSILQAGGKERYECAKSYNLIRITLGTVETIFTGHQLYDTFIINTGNPALMDRSPLQVTLFLVSRHHHDLFSVSSSVPVSSFKVNSSHLIDKLTAGNRENMHAPTLPHSLLNYFSPAEFGQSARVFTVEYALWPFRLYVSSSSTSRTTDFSLILQISLGLIQMDGLNALVSIEEISKTFSARA
ncbi:hypothetical protein M422DRAFT_251582 [Sphaerobolus stellatus SS14]|uniref:Unplaced genomic scaffold SPHSTscaffold_39, whole genome shotgun sequence n=1 Tax=Sphaerobolus stellatus (strain SS14) TaxID=990650 RepID=A0A0C9UQ03_SPHS4|nr:hypothetical protein M422DRAFT_251582 [Sphaerobolus stellatus SS14]